jgi:hypothetical protein
VAKATAKAAGGRPTDYSPAYNIQAAKLCALGATDEEIADFFDVDVRTIYRWKEKHPEFCQALKSNKDALDARVEKSLFQNAIGGNVTAQIFWLKNRQPKQWRDNHGLSAFIGTVVTAKPIDCGVQITVDVARSSAPSLPAKIVIDVLPCSFWRGAIGDTISAVVFEAPKQTGAYKSSIQCDPTT